MTFNKLKYKDKVCIIWRIRGIDVSNRDDDDDDDDEVVNIVFIVQVFYCTYLVFFLKK